jgi:hypothetical protein
VSVVYVPPGGAELDGPHPWTAYGLTGTSWATWSPCRTYRYTLGRVWEVSKPGLVFVGLNPSTADAHAEDPTIRKLVGYAKRWGLGGLTMLNLFGYRSTDPDKLPRLTVSAAGPLNDAALTATFQLARKDGDTLALGWGVHGGTRDRLDRSARIVERAHVLHGSPMCFGLTKGGQPKHPLYLANAAQLVRML